MQPVAYRDALKLGLHLDLPLCRWGFHVLPHHRTALNVFQPQYTLMFEKLLAGPQPWLYGHVYLEGGVDRLDSADYALEPGTKAALTGTLMQVVAVQREDDSRLSLIVQGLARGIVLRPTQGLPYARADFQLFADDEALRVSARRARRFLGATEMGSVGSPLVDMDGVRRRLTQAAVVAEERHWWAYEHANLSLSTHQTLAQVIAPMPAEAASGEAGAISAGLEETPMAPAVCYGPAGWEEEASASDREKAMAHDELYAGCKPMLTALTRAVEADAALSEEAAASAVGAPPTAHTQCPCHVATTALLVHVPHCMHFV